MSKKEKLIEKLKSKPKNFSYTEAKKIFEYFSFQEFCKGKTSGSRMSFINEKKHIFCLHKPHPKNELKSYQINEIISFLEERGLI